MFKTKRAREVPEPGDGTRYLVDRLWPRGVSKDTLKLDAWLQDVAPSTPLRKWFNHDAAKWDEFRRLYFAELDTMPGTWQPLVDRAKVDPVTLVYDAYDADHNNAVALAEYLRSKLGGAS